MSSGPPSGGNENPHEVAGHLSELIDTYIAEDDLHAHQTVLAPATPDKVSSVSETTPQKGVPWHRKILDKIGAIVTNEAAYFHDKYGNNVYHPETGKTEYEFVPLAVRIGMHTLFCGGAQEKVLEDGYLRNLFLKQSVKQGKHFDEPSSVESIAGFVKTYGITLEELLIQDIKTGYKNFNEFFYRKLKPDARPAHEPEDDKHIVSAADCRLVVFNDLQEGQKIWIKGDKFTVPSLLQNTVPDPTIYEGGSVCVFRLAPQDYHRFHSPVTGTIVGPPVDIPGALFTVNPMAVRSTLDVFTTNKRSVVQIQTRYSKHPVAFIAVGAMLVGSINWTADVTPGASIKKGEELGYFAYGGSTVILLMPRDMQFKAEKLLEEKSADAVEVVVKVGRHVGTAEAAPVS